MINESVDEKRLRTEGEMNDKNSSEYEVAATKEKRILIVEDNDHKYEEVKELLKKY